MSYKAIGFDYGGVLGGVHTSGPSFFDEVADALGMQFEEFSKNYLMLNDKINCGEIKTWAEFWQIFLKKYNRLDALETITAMSDAYAEKLNAVDASMLKLVDALREKGFAVGLLSNTSIERVQEMKALGIHEHFDSFLVSAEIGVMKPNPDAFKRLCQELHVEQKELLFVDDSEYSLSTAKECGYMPILFENYLQLVKDLKQFGIVVQ